MGRRASGRDSSALTSVQAHSNAIQADAMTENSGTNMLAPSFGGWAKKKREGDGDLVQDRLQSERNALSFTILG
jgi:hypothetical protein